MKPYNEIFEGIRPFYNHEIPDAMRRIVNDKAFPIISSWVFPDRDREDVKKMLLSFTEIEEFQKAVMIPVNEQVISRSMTEFTYQGLEKIDPNKQYLYVSNHRDIMLDACLLNYLLLSNGRHTSQITFGANLMYPGLITDIGKCNKMFRVERGGKRRDFFLSSQLLSNYIRETISNYGESVWIAQRNGRTKDGIDKTEPGLINMFGLSDRRDKISSLSALHIVPVSISYEWESCDILKAIELYESRHERYVKKPGEDLNSIITGLIQPKGHVNITICDEITEEELGQFDALTRNEFSIEVAALIDRRINSSFKLNANNYIAHDMRYGQSKYQTLYNEKQYNTFVEYMSKLDDYDVDSPDILNDIFLGIYSNPINNRQ